jgi:hypothetical protein
MDCRAWNILPDRILSRAKTLQPNPFHAEKGK